MNYVLGIDVGTTAVKAVLLDQDGALGPVASARYSLNAGGEGRFEQDPEEMLGAIAQAVQQAAAGQPVCGIGLSTQGAALLVLDEANQPLRPIVSWMDHRAAAEKQELLDRFGDSFFAARTGMPRPGCNVPALLWLNRHEPDVMARVRRVSLVEDWLGLWLTGEGCSDPTNAIITGMMNLDTLDWDAELLAAVGVDAALLPPMRRAGDALGGLRPEAAARLGLAAGIPVAAAGHDQHMAGLGAGLVEPGMSMLSTGTAWVTFAISADIDRAKAVGLYAAPSVLGAGWGALDAMPSGNGYFDRMVESLGVADYAQADAEAEAAGVGAGGLAFVPCVAGNREAAWVGLRLDHGRGHMLRAVMEGLAMEAAFMFRNMEAATGRVREVRMLGGSSKSRLWAQIAASAL